MSEGPAVDQRDRSAITERTPLTRAVRDGTPITTTLRLGQREP